MYKAVGEQHVEMQEIVTTLSFQCRELMEKYNTDIVGNSLMCFLAFLLSQSVDTEEELEQSIKVFRKNALENFNNFKTHEYKSKKTD